MKQEPLKRRRPAARKRGRKQTLRAVVLSVLTVSVIALCLGIWTKLPGEDVPVGGVEPPEEVLSPTSSVVTPEPEPEPQPVVETIRFSAETDRVYQDTTATVEIRDPELQRSIFVRKSGSKSTVVWNPWIEKSIRMPDFGDDEYPQMVCVESGNVREHSVTLAPGEKTSMVVELDSLPLV